MKLISNESPGPDCKYAKLYDRGPSLDSHGVLEDMAHKAYQWYVSLIQIILSYKTVLSKLFSGEMIFTSIPNEIISNLVAKKSAF